MKKTNIYLTILFIITSSVIYAKENSRIIENFNFGWKFHAGDIADGASLQLNDYSWRNVDLPHDFQIEQPWVSPDSSETGSKDITANTSSVLSARGFKAMGIGWYRKSFIPDPSYRGKRILLDFEGIMLYGDVWINGEKLGGSNYGYLGFEMDITNHIQFDKANVIAVKTNTGQPDNCRWYTGGGIFRDVHLIGENSHAAFSRHGIYITTPQICSDSATISIQAEVMNYTKKNLEVTIYTTVFDPSGNKIIEKPTKLTLWGRPISKEYQLPKISVPLPRLWSCENPNLYTVKMNFENDKTKENYDEIEETFGIRSIEYTPESGLKLNGKKVLLKGVANHHDLGALGAATYNRAIEKRFKLLKSFGVNHIRTSHNPYSKSFLDLADKYGILIVDELFDKWEEQYAGYRIPWSQLWQDAVPEFIKRDRNHPSVVMWSLGNELQNHWQNPYKDWGVTPYRLMNVLIKRYDNTRPTTVAMFPARREKGSLPADLALATEIASYNYRYFDFPEDSKMYPEKVFYQSEASVNDMGPNYFGMNLDKVIGLAYWGAIDYLGESRGWPAKGWNLGVFDISLQPRAQAYLLKSLFSNEPTVHIGIVDDPLDDKNKTWNNIKVASLPLTSHWNFKEGKSLSLYTYTNAEEVELFVNGKSLGIKKNELNDPERRNKIFWEGIKYQKGNITAIARSKHKEVARHKLETTGKAIALQLQADTEDWKADGNDLQHIRVYAVDSKGRRVYNAGNTIHFSVTGNATLIAVDNGNIYSNEQYTGDSRKLFKGSALTILKSGNKPSKIIFKAYTERLKSATLNLITK